MRIAHLPTAALAALILVGCPAGVDDKHNLDPGLDVGPAVELGEFSHDEVKLAVSQAGDSTQEVVLRIQVLSHAKKIQALRVWVGPENREGSSIAIGKRVGDAYLMRLELPAEKEGARIWFEIETVGSKKLVPFDIKDVAAETKKPYDDAAGGDSGKDGGDQGSE